jgi:cyclopropane-fatty-acyl-phospholipid synthase
MDSTSIAPSTLDPDATRHEVPVAFYEMVTGRHLKLSCCLFDEGCDGLSEAEAAMLERTCARAEIDDGMRILELGCGWGSLSLWIAQHFPAGRVTAVTHSRGHKRFVDARAKARGIGNLDVIATDMNSFEPDSRFDRVLCVERFESMRNWRALMGAVARWLDSGGKLFLQVACHRAVPYLFRDEAFDDWLARLLFPGIMMPSAALALQFQEAMALERVYHVNGRQYARTCEAWLANLERRSGEALEVLARGQSPVPARIQLQRWRLFFLASAEQFAYRGGNEWFVAHYRFLRS